MAVKMLTEKRGALQGVTINSIVKQVYGLTAEYRTDGDWEGYAGAITRHDAAHDSNTVLDYVLDVHDE